MACLMKDEILSEPQVLRKAVSNNIGVVKTIVAEVKKRNIHSIATVARGSSDNAVMSFKYVSEILSGYTVMELHPSIVTMYKSNINLNNYLMIAVSQSGKSIDTLAVLDQANRSGAITVAVTNDPTSPLARGAQYHLDLSCGEERSVAATKTFAAELMVLYMLAIELSGKDLYPILYAIPDKLAELSARYDEFRDVGRSISDQTNTIVLTRGPMQGVGRELALKYKECCYIMSQFYSVSDFMHGPLAIIDENSSVLLLAPDGECAQNYIDMATRLSLLGAKITAITDMKEVGCVADHTITMPKVDMISSTLLYAFVGHIMIFEIAREKGLNPDLPRNLKKVTVTK